MNIAVTGGTGFLGRSIVARLANAGHRLLCWHRPTSDRSHFPTTIPEGRIRWFEGELGDDRATLRLVEGVDAVVHAALDHPGGGFRAQDAELIPFLEKNFLGSIRLVEAARRAGVARFVYISSCAVHDKILTDRPLDETHPLWMSNHYGAHKAAVEAFVHSFGYGLKYPICALRPTGIYGLAHPVPKSKWYDLIAKVARGEPVECRGGGKEVHAEDVAKAVEMLLGVDESRISGEAYNCCDRYISQHEVATIAKRLSGGRSEIQGEPSSPRNSIETGKIRSLGMVFGGSDLLERTIESLLAAVPNHAE